MRLRLVATPYRDGADRAVLIVHTDTGSVQETQSHKMETLGRLAAGVAHDFANLVTLISGYTDILLTASAPAIQPFGTLEEIRKASARGAAPLLRSWISSASRFPLPPPSS